MKKTLALLLAAVMLLGLAACAKSPAPTEPAETEGSTAAAETQPASEPETLPPTEPETQPATEPETQPDETGSGFDAEAAAAIIGSWQLDFLLNGEAMDMEGFETEVIFPMVFTFDDQGIMSIFFDVDDAAIEAFYSDMRDYLINLMYEEFANEGLEQEAADEAFQQTYNMTIAEYTDILLETLDLASLFSSVEGSCVYYVDGQKLYSNSGIEGDDEYEIITFTVTGETLTLLDTNEPESWEALGLTMPVTLTRINP